MDIIRDEELKRQIFKDILYSNKVMIANKLMTYYMVRDGQDRYCDQVWTISLFLIICHELIFQVYFYQIYQINPYDSPHFLVSFYIIFNN